MKIAYISANCGGTDKNLQDQHKKQTVPVDYFYFDDSNFPPRSEALHPRLQAKIPKMFGWDLVPGYDYYIWADATITLSNEIAVEWLLSKVRGHDIALFRHHDKRSSIGQELRFMERRMNGLRGDSVIQEYLNNRYQHEPMEAQVDQYLSDPNFTDDMLYSGGLFIYANTREAREMLKDWFTENARWSIQDQLSLPYVLSKSGCKVKTIKRNLLKNEYVEYHQHGGNLHKWDTLYQNLPSEPSAFVYGDTETYKLGADFLTDCAVVEDWGVGAGGFKRYRKDAIGVDGSMTPHADEIADLTEYQSICDGIFMRHVLEHNREWKSILSNALQSAEEKLVIVLFTPLSDNGTSEIEGSAKKNGRHGVNVPDLSISRGEFMELIMEYAKKATESTIPTATKYGSETIIYIEKRVHETH